MEKKEKHWQDWTRKEFEALPCADWKNEIGEIDSLIILPTRHKHDSGFRCMEFVAIQGDKPAYIVSGCSDVIHLAGICGCNIDYRNANIDEYSNRVKNNAVPRISWRIDSLPVSGLLRLFCDKHIYIGRSLSSFEIFAKEEK